MFVCICHGINEKAIQKAVSEGAKNVREVRKTLHLGSQCGQCVRQAHEVIEQAKNSAQKAQFYAA